MLTISDEEADLFEAIRAGANGYLLKDIPLDEVADGDPGGARRPVADHPRRWPRKLLTEFARSASGPSEPRGQVAAPRLTDREIEVLQLVARGMNNRESPRSCSSPRTPCKNHVRNILEKLQMHSRMEAAMYAVRQRLIDPGE